ncbi:type II secretion system F family protein [Paenibacillus xylaniclasticus]|uniref:type II secretion system F family protein n=1 Tax=Paenibacillus xylaniclasticus TaxID=588083 RepID=UPI000FDC24E5|nr:MULTISPECIES: type II secretion system F family protein [Paenibacillus]
MNPFYRGAAWLGWNFDFEHDRNGLRLPDYSEYRLSPHEFMLSLAAGVAGLFIIAYTFYQSLPAAVMLSPAGALLPRYRKAGLLAKRRERLQLQFKEALHSVTSSLAAGRSVDNAFLAAEADLQLLYPGGSADIVLEFAALRHRILNGDTLESGLRMFAERARLDDITQFVDVFQTCKRTGGDLVDVIRRTSQVIGEKLDIGQEISVMLAQKRFESRILTAIPFVFMAALNMAAPDYMKPLYEGAGGYILLTLLLAGFIGCGAAIHKLMQIKL